MQTQNVSKIATWIQCHFYWGGGSNDHPAWIGAEHSFRFWYKVERITLQQCQRSYWCLCHLPQYLSRPLSSLSKQTSAFSFLAKYPLWNAEAVMGLRRTILVNPTHPFWKAKSCQFIFWSLEFHQFELNGSIANCPTMAYLALDAQHVAMPQIHGEPWLCTACSVIHIL